MYALKGTPRGWCVISEEDNSNASVGNLVKDFKSIDDLFQTYFISHVRR